MSLEDKQERELKTIRGYKIGNYKSEVIYGVWRNIKLRIVAKWTGSRKLIMLAGNFSNKLL